MTITIIPVWTVIVSCVSCFLLSQSFFINHNNSKTTNNTEGYLFFFQINQILHGEKLIWDVSCQSLLTCITQQLLKVVAQDSTAFMCEHTKSSAPPWRGMQSNVILKRLTAAQNTKDPINIIDDGCMRQKFSRSEFKQKHRSVPHSLCSYRMVNGTTLQLLLLNKAVISQLKVIFTSSIRVTFCKNKAEWCFANACRSKQNTSGSFLLPL